jgi:hypothetical protein
LALWGPGGRVLFALILHSAGPENYFTLLRYFIWIQIAIPKNGEKKPILLVQMLVYMKMKLTFVAGTYSITHVRNAEIKTVVTTCFHYALRY